MESLGLHTGYGAVVKGQPARGFFGMPEDVTVRIAVGVLSAAAGSALTFLINFGASGEEINRGDASDFMRSYYDTAVADPQYAWDHMLDRRLRQRHKNGFADFNGYYDDWSEVTHSAAIPTGTKDLFYLDVTFTTKEGELGTPQAMYVTLKCTDRFANRLPFLHCDLSDLVLRDTFSPTARY